MGLKFRNLGFNSCPAMFSNIKVKKILKILNFYILRNHEHDTSTLQDDQNERSQCSIWTTAGSKLGYSRVYKIGFSRTRVKKSSKCLKFCELRAAGTLCTRDV